VKQQIKGFIPVKQKGSNRAGRASKGAEMEAGKLKYKGGSVMPISSEYASISEDKRAILLPDDVQRWVNGAQRFVAVMERDELILKKAHEVRPLDEVVSGDAAPISSEELNAVIHEARK